MRRRNRTLWCLSIVGAVVATWLMSRTTEPTYKGRSLSAWLETYYHSSDDESVHEEAAAAIRRIGTNAIPYLVANVRYEVPDWMSKVELGMDRLPGPFSSWWRDVMSKCATRVYPALAGFYVLGSNAAPAIPHLISMLDSRYIDTATDTAGVALKNVGTPAIPALVATLTNWTNPAYQRAGAAWTLGLMGTNASCAVGVLIKCLDDEIEVANMAAGSLGVVAVDTDSERVVTALTNAMPGSSPKFCAIAIWSLGVLGKEAREAIPVLEKSLLDTDPMITDAAKQALAKIEPEKYVLRAKREVMTR